MIQPLSCDQIYPADGQRVGRPVDRSHFSQDGKAVLTGPALGSQEGEKHGTVAKNVITFEEDLLSVVRVLRSRPFLQHLLRGVSKDGIHSALSHPAAA
jgi:hypothetical protein